MPKISPLAAAAAAVVAVAGGLGLGAWLAFGPGGGDDRFAHCRATALAGGGMSLGGPFELTRGDGARVTQAEVFDRITLLYFGYTYCPDICPFDVADMGEALHLLDERGVEANAAFVTVDPARDTPEAVGDFASLMHPRMIGLTGSAEEIDAAAKAWRVYYAKAGDDPEDYLMDHSTFTYLIAPGGEFLDVFRRETSPEQMADAVQCFAEAL